jgi:hypothetical protein
MPSCEMGKLIYFFIMIISCLLSCRDNEKLVEFKPLEFTSNGDYVVKKDIPNEFYINLKMVLKEYNIHYLDSNGVIFISYRDYRSKELVSNYTEKALDTVWLKNK